MKVHIDMDYSTRTFRLDRCTLAKVERHSTKPGQWLRLVFEMLWNGAEISFVSIPAGELHKLRRARSWCGLAFWRR